MPPTPLSSLDKLRRMLNRGERVTLDRAAETLDVSRRQIRRLLKQLGDKGLHIRESFEDGVKHFRLDPQDRQVDTTITLSENELEALTVATLAAQSVLGPTPFGGGIGDAVDTLLQHAGALYSFEPEWQDEIWHFDGGPQSQVDPAMFLAVVRAANGNETLQVTYFTASSQRTSERKINPLCVARQGTSWLIAAYCHENQDVRDFSIAGMRDVDPTGTFFTRPPDFDPETHFAGRFHALKGAKRQQVVIDVEPDKAPYFQRKEYHPSQTIRDQRDNGALRVAFEVASLDDIAAFIRSWGPGVRVVSPAELAERIAAEAREMAEAYDRQSPSGTK